MPERHGFVQLAVGGRIEERYQRAEDGSSAHGYVEQAAYVQTRAGGWLARLLRPRRGSAPRAHLLRPFDGEGRDVLGLLSAPPAPLAPDEDRATEPRRVSGRVSRLSSNRSVVVEDAWFGRHESTWRVTEGVDFVIDLGPGDAIVVSFGLAPLVVARPETVALDEHLSGLTPETRRLVPAARTTGEAGERLRIAVGDSVEVWGVCRGVSDSVRRFDFAGRGDYRTAPRPARVVGDEDGTRLVIFAPPRP